MSIYQPNLMIFHATLIRNEQGDFIEVIDVKRRNHQGKKVDASKRDFKRLEKQLDI